MFSQQKAILLMATYPMLRLENDRLNNFPTTEQYCYYDSGNNTIKNRSPFKVAHHSGLFGENELREWDSDKWRICEKQPECYPPSFIDEIKKEFEL